MSGSSGPCKPEVMSPAGYWPQLQAAVEAGADAVYFGLTHFTARAKVGFSLGELPQALSGRLPRRELTRQLQELAPQGATEGSLFVADDYLALPLLEV